MDIKLIREYDAEVTEGIIYDDKAQQICYSLELPDRNNEPKISCIPEGTYHFHTFQSPHLGHVYRLENVPNRDLIDIHVGNTVLDIEGCILVGLERGVRNIHNKIYPAVLSSGDHPFHKGALSKLFGIAGNEGTITITSNKGQL